MDLCERRPLTAERHFWELARAEVALTLLHRQLDRVRPGRLLDFGCGDGFLLGKMAEAFPGWDFLAFDPALPPGLAAELSVGNRRATADPAAADYRFFQAVTMFDVLEHIADDRAFLRALHDGLPPGAALTVTVPAFQGLYSGHDAFLKHFRRYRRTELTGKLREAGFRVERSGYFFCSLLLPRLVQKGLGGPCRGIGGGALRPPALNHALAAFLKLDAAVGRAAAECGIQLPGLSVYALCTG